MTMKKLQSVVSPSFVRSVVGALPEAGEQLGIDTHNADVVSLRRRCWINCTAPLRFSGTMENTLQSGWLLAIHFVWHFGLFGEKFDQLWGDRYRGRGEELG
jgi:hypothetical protein